jgi:hypothetical protein
MLALQHLERSTQSCEVIFQREGFDVETFYWAGSMAEVQELAREIVFRGCADTFRIVEFTSTHERCAIKSQPLISELGRRQTVG